MFRVSKPGRAISWLVLLSLVPTGGAAQEVDPASLARADSVRAAYALVRPPASHGTDWVDVVGFPLKVVGFPLDVLLVRLPAFAIGELTVPRKPGFLVRALRSANAAGVRPSLRTSISPGSGIGVGVLIDRFDPLYINSSISVAGSQVHLLGILFGTERNHARAEVGWQREARTPFYGVGPATPDDEVLYGREITEASASGRTQVGDVLGLELAVGYEDNRVREPLSIGDDESLFERFSPGTLFGSEGRQRFVRIGAFAELDLTRRVEFQRRGATVRAGGVTYRGVSNTSSDFHKLFGTLQGLLPLNDRQGLSLRGQTEVTRADGGEVPFYHLAFLGGRRSAIGFPSHRFADLDMVSLVAEWRYEIWRDIHTTARLETFLYFGEGAVARRLGEIAASDWRESYGVGFRMAGTEGLMVLTYLGFSEESTHFGVSGEWQP